MDYPIKTVCVVGLGYIGLPTAATLASRGIDVIGVDINPRVVEAVNAGQTYFSEPDLDMLLRAATTLRKLRATAQPEPADAFVIAVPTPFREDRSPNLDYIDLAADAIAPVLVSGNVVILESTSPVGTTGRLADRLARLRPDLRFPPTRHCGAARCACGALPGAGASRADGPRADRERSHHRRDDRSLRRACRSGLPGVSASEGVPHRCGDGGTGQARRECLARRQHCFCQRAVADLRPARPQCVARHRARQSPSPGLDPPAGTGGRRALHRRRSVVHHFVGAGANAADPHRSRGQRFQAQVCRLTDPGTRRAVQATGRRLFRSDLQARCRRHAGEPGDRDRGSNWRAPGRTASWWPIRT